MTLAFALQQTKIRFMLGALYSILHRLYSFWKPEHSDQVQASPLRSKSVEEELIHSIVLSTSAGIDRNLELEQSTQSLATKQHVFLHAQNGSICAQGATYNADTLANHVFAGQDDIACNEH